MGNQAKQQGARGIWLLPAAAATYLEILFLAGRLSLLWRRRRQRLGLSGVYSKLMSCGTDVASDRILVHTESLLYPQRLGPRSTGSKLWSRRASLPSLAEGLPPSEAASPGCFSVHTTSLQLLRLERAFGRCSQAEGGPCAIEHHPLQLACSFLSLFHAC